MSKTIKQNCLLTHNWSGENWEKSQWPDHFIEVIERFNEWGVRWFPMQGTLLGKVRDERFIEGSGDIDLGILAEDLDKIKAFGSIADWFGGRPVYFNYHSGKYPIINVQAYHKIKGSYFYFSHSVIQQEIRTDTTIEELLTNWYGDWETPAKTHAKVFNYKLTIESYEN